MAKGVNGLLVTLDSFGATIQGTLYGSSGPQIDALSDQIVRVFSKTVHLLEPVSSFGNNKFYLPAIYGKNIVFLFVEGKAYFPHQDFDVHNSIITWKNTSVSLLPEHTIVAFGPANNYTAEAFSYEVLDLLDENIFIAENENYENKATLQLNDTWPQSKKPFSENSIFVFKNHHLYSPNIHFNYVEDDNIIVWEDVETAPLSSDIINVFYYNREDTLPFKLGDVLFRANLPVSMNEQEQFYVAARPYKILLDSANVFYNKLRYAYRQDYTINSMVPMVLNVINESNGGSLLPELSLGNLLDVSYFADSFISDTVSILNVYFNNDFMYDGSTLLPTYKIQPLPPVGDPIDNKLSLFFFRGVLAVNKYYSNYPNGLESSSIAQFPSENQKWEWEVAISNVPPYRYVRWHPEARLAAPGLIPSGVSGFGDFLTWSAFTDPVSKNSIRIEYYQINQDQPEVELTTEMLGGNKCIVWYNGQALFNQFGHFTVEEDNKTLSEFYYNKLPNLANNTEDEIVVLYFVEAGYASLWKFEGITLEENITSGTDIQFNYTINSLANSFLFNNGIRIDNKDYTVGANSSSIKLTNGETLLAGSQIMLVHT